MRANRDETGRERTGWPVVVLVGVLLVGMAALSAAPARAACSEDHPLCMLISLEPAAAQSAGVIQLGADPWGRFDDRVWFRVSQEMADTLAARGVDYVLEEADVYAAWEAAQTKPRAIPFVDYHDLGAVEAALQRMASQHPDLAALEVIGQSLQGRDIYALRLSDDAGTIDLAEPAVLVIGCHHAREWISVEVPLYFADYLLDNYGQVGAVTRLLNYSEVWIVPVLNPDGFQYSWTTDRWWRKNRRDNGDGTWGVDINRNYGYMFGGDGASDDPSAETYHGPGAFSEPETGALRDLMNGTTFGRTFVGGLSYHNYSQVILFPWGYTTDPVANFDEYDAISGYMADLINASHSDPQYDYLAGQAAATLYNTNGDFTDWAQGELGVMAMTVEVRPSGPPYFELPAEEIVPTCVENLPAFLYFAEQRAIPELAALDGDADGYVEADDYCPASPAGAAVDAMGCAAVEQDLDGDGVLNALDECRDSLAGQQVDAAGCRVPALFRLDVQANVESTPLEVSPADIDAAGAGNTGTAGFAREYATQTTLTLTAPAEWAGARFTHWLINGAEQPAGQSVVLYTAAEDTVAEAVYVVPVAVEVAGPQRIPDERSRGVAYLVTFDVEVLYSDGSRLPIDADDIQWTVADESVGMFGQGGQFVPYNVTAAAGELTTPITAAVVMGETVQPATPVTLTVYDAETLSPHCEEVAITGPATVTAASETVYTADVHFESEVFIDWDEGRLVWDLLAPEGSELAVLPAQLTAAGVLTTLWVGENTDVVVRATYPNDNGTLCSVERTVTIEAGDPEAGAAAGTVPCGAGGATAMLGVLLGLAGFRAVATRRQR